MNRDEIENHTTFLIGMGFIRYSYSKVHMSKQLILNSEFIARRSTAKHSLVHMLGREKKREKDREIERER